MMYWSQGLASRKFIKKNINTLSDKTVVDCNNFIRVLCVGYFIRHLTIIDGVDHVVEIDGSAWTKRKYNRSRQVGTQCVFGEIDRDINECFAVVVDRHDTATLISIIYQYVLPDTVICSDQWLAYNAINNDSGGCIYQTVNHSINFVDLTTLVRT